MEREYIRYTHPCTDSAISTFQVIYEDDDDDGDGNEEDENDVNPGGQPTAPILGRGKQLKWEESSIFA